MTSLVSKTHPDYDEHFDEWELCEDVIDGEKAIHKAREKYLPKLGEEQESDYKARLARTPFFAATERTLLGLQGMIMRKPATVTLPPAVAKMAEDVTLGGESLVEFVAEVLEEDLTTDRCGVLVDYPPAPKTDRPLTVAMAQAQGLRPTLQRYEADSILNWRYEKINGAKVLTMVVLKETAEEWENEFSVTEAERFRVLDLENGVYRQRLYKVEEERDILLEEHYPLMGGKPLNFIPFDVDPDIDTPPLYALARMNIHHYQVSADYEHGCHLSGLPTMFISGYTPAASDSGTDSKIYIGGPTANALPQADAKAYYVEVSGDFAALSNNLQRKELQMAILGARMLETMKKAQESADTASIHRKGEESILATIARKRSERMTRVLKWFTEWAGADSSEVSYELNRDFYPTPLDPTFLQSLFQGLQSGAWSHEALFWNLQQRDFYPPDTTFEEEQARIGNEGPTFAVSPPASTAGASAGREPTTPAA